MTWPPPASASVCSAASASPVLVERDDVDEDLGVLDRRVATSIGVSLVSAPSESTSSVALALGRRPASTAGMTPS